MAKRNPVLTRTDLLLRPEKEVTSHLSRLGRSIAAETPFRVPLVFAPKVLRPGGRGWSFQKNPHTKLASSGRGEEQIIELVRVNEHVLYLGATEEWGSVPRGLVFVESRLRFYHGQPGRDLIGAPMFRLEWHDREENLQTGQFEFPSVGAAHPHWQFGGEITGAEAEDSAEGISKELATQEVDETIRLEQGDSDEGVEVSRSDRQRRSLLKRFHFPAKAGWAAGIWDPVVDREGSPMHACGPKNPEELDYWTISAIRYVRCEFKKHMT